MAMHLTELLEPLQAELRGEDRTFSSVSTDSRKLRRGDLFVALSGEHFDAHDYLQQVARQGAVAAMVRQADKKLDLPQLQVMDTRKGLGQLAAQWRRKKRVPMVAITGSNGKTTVKEMLAAIVGECGQVLSTQGNLNNEIGMPLTLLRQQEQDYAVIEMGASHSGEIAQLTGWADPDVVLINNAAAAHLQGFGSLQGVARAKGEIIQSASSSAIVIFNADDPYADLWRQMAAQRRCISFGRSAQADVRLQDENSPLQWDVDGYSNRFRVRLPNQQQLLLKLPLAGQHNRMNATAALAAAYALDIDKTHMQKGLHKMQAVAGRLRLLVNDEKRRLIDDSYNANPASVEAAIEVLAGAPGQRVLVLGDLAELGKDAGQMQASLGRYARHKGLDALLTVGSGAALAAQAFGQGGHSFATQQQVLEQLLQWPTPLSVLVKGSRSAAMDQLAAALQQAWSNSHAD
ncbi:MAG: UDP-N-acetylmuramoyl-tripeptide--D-alanyl-D-alanine ligase [gamma proteobacterium symbiont of Bathyaustriella thionipta]|nr:UDP-N-acetylmuramoyl-tripeptide--D-alanyl-D-alanine ligase [gamma proteobacterium symbiont of Bathyaustriella thionipta]